MTAETQEQMIRSGLIALVAGFIAAPFIFKLLVKTNSRQTISEFVPEHAVKQGTPTMGGLIVIVGLLASMAVPGFPRNLAGVILVLWFSAIGFLDDYVVPKKFPGKRGLGWSSKLALQLVPFMFFPLLGVADLGHAVVYAFVVLFFSNAYNFSDGMDGLAATLGMVLAITLALIPFMIGGWHGYTFESVGASVLLAGLFGALIPFLALNTPPAKVFMGDVGSLPIGAVLGWGFLGVTGLRSDASLFEPRLLLVCLPMLFVLFAEIVPVPLQIASAKLRKGKRLFPFRTPVHHGFQAAGWPEKRVVMLFVATQVVVSSITIVLIQGLGMVSLQGGGR